MKKSIIAVLAAAVLVLGLSACATPTSSTPVNANQFLLCDTGPSQGCGSNPEHGLDKTCFSINRMIARIEDAPDNQLLVTCGPELSGEGPAAAPAQPAR